MHILPRLFWAGTEDVRAWPCFVWSVFWHEGGALCHQIWVQSHFPDTHDDDSHICRSPPPPHLHLFLTHFYTHDDSLTTSYHTFEDEAHTIVFKKGSYSNVLSKGHPNDLVWELNWNKSIHCAMSFSWPHPCFHSLTISNDSGKIGKAKKRWPQRDKSIFSTLYCLCDENASQLWNEAVGSALPPLLISVSHQVVCFTRGCALCN